MPFTGKEKAFYVLEYAQTIEQYCAVCICERIC